MCNYSRFKMLLHSINWFGYAFRHTRCSLKMCIYVMSCDGKRIRFDSNLILLPEGSETLREAQKPEVARTRQGMEQEVPPIMTWRTQT